MKLEDKYLESYSDNELHAFRTYLGILMEHVNHEQCRRECVQDGSKK